MKYRIPAFEIDIVFDWEKSGCDLLLYYTFEGNRSYFGLVCTDNFKYVSDDVSSGCRGGAGESVADAKTKLEKICAKQVAGQQINFNADHDQRKNNGVRASSGLIL